MAEITDRKSFEEWLEGKPVEWAQVLAVRAALRVLPLVGQVFDINSLKPKDQEQLIFASWRAIAISWVGRKYPTHDIAIAARDTFAAADAADAAAFAADAFAFTAARTAAYAARPAAFATFAAARAADAAVRAASRAADAAAAAADAARAIFAAADTAAAAALAAFATDAVFAAVRAGFWSALNREAEFLAAYKGTPEFSAQALAEQVLWLNDKGDNATPDWALLETKKLTDKMSDLNDNWQVWGEWYQSRLDGKESWGLNPNNAETLMLRIADQENDWWEQGPSIVNAEIAGWLSEFRTEEASDEILPDKLPERPTQELVENSAATSFIVRDGKFEVSPTNVWADDLHRAENLRNMAVVLAQKMHQQFLNTNAEPGLARNISDGLSILQQPISSIQPDQLRLFGQSISAKARTYGHPNAEWELSAEIVQNLFGLSTLLEDLQGFVKSDLKENAEAIRALDINPENLDKAKALGDDVLAAVQAHGSFFTDSAIGVFEIASKFSENTPTEHVQVMVEGERILLTENLAVAIARELAKPDVQNGAISSSQKDVPYLIDFKNRFVDRLSEDLPEAIADGLKKDIPKSIGYLGGSIAAIIYALSSLGIITAASSIIIAAAWITYELRRRIRELDAQDGKGNKDDEP